LPAEVILIPKKLRAEWMDVMALDSALSHVAFRAAGVIGSHFNKVTGKAFLGQTTIAAAMGVSPRTAWSAVKELEERGYLIIGRRKLGEGVRATKSGPQIIKHAGAKGVANTYVPAFEKSQIFATTVGSALAARCDQYWSDRSQNSVSKIATGSEPTLTSPSGKNPAELNHNLGKAGDRLIQLIGPEMFTSWFMKVSAIEVAGEGRVVISVPNHFFANYIRTRFSDLLRQAWDVKDVEVIVVARQTERDDNAAQSRRPREIAESQ
jgi:hypothetical protein